MPDVALPQVKLQDCQKLLEAAKHAKKPHERDAWLNLAFYLDEQYVEWHVETDTLRVIPRESGDRRPRPTQNKIMQYIRQLHSAALQDKPQGDVLPATGDTQDISDAHVAKAYVDEQQDPVNINYNRQVSRTALLALIMGTAWQKWVWDPINKRNDCIPVPLQEGFPDPFAKTFDKCRYFIHGQFMDIEQVYDQFGIEVKPDQVERADLLKTELMRSMGSAPVLKGCTVYELWHKPSRRYPDGLYAVWCGKQFLVSPRPLPYKVLREERKLPFTIYGALERPDSLYYLSPVKYLRAAQMELNQYHAQRILLRQKFANAKWFLPAGLELNEDPDDSIAQILRGNDTAQPGLEPKLIQPSTYIPNDDGDMLERGMMNIVGQHEVSQAQVPGRVEAAKAIEMLLNQDADSLATLRECMAQSNSEGWYLVLEYARQFEQQEKMVLAYSREGVPEVKRFFAGQMKPGYRVRTTMTNGLANTRSARYEQLTRLWDSKIITDPQMMAELLDLPLPSILGDQAEDVREARNENLEMADGIPVEPRSWQDHAIHLREHNRFRKTDEWRKLDEEGKNIFEFHCQTHEKLLLVALQKQAALAQASGMAPAPAPSGGGGGPEAPATPPDAADQSQGGTPA